ncbi:MarR family winged helix-turn-helix transcriptional regulator [Actinomadura montaniterrae]|uniref:Winged helix-turn-helix transcriptional regulator n=1 Tax=Actinomadura montaniterrae TaxID=1803903 RepID=A0A6L3VTU2_9ACTN|nr:MarR family winged helix-turn-helix transcriptional regulator [Actinomadura montaniterrae]KAB2381317.1 winged helix-turn-helix transcriptional regulator [Actinomadura montaniterrae]
MSDAGGLPATVAFRLGTLGAIYGDRLAAKIAVHDLKLKHAGLMTALEAGVAASQQDLAARMGVAPSLVVALADHLVRLGAIERRRDPADRRRQVLTLTGHGRELLRRCAEAAREVDEEISAPLGADQRAALHDALGAIAERAGLPTS